VTDRIHLGFEVGTGESISVPMHHAIVSGVTGLSGKTTAISAMLSRLPEGYKSLVFSTKRGEISFEGAHQVQPFYKATVDWEYVSGVLEAARKEKLKFERSWIIKASRGASTLRDVYQNIVAALEGGKPLRGLDESVWTVLRAYFEKVLPELESQPWAPALDLAQGVNVMHLAHLSEEVQGLVIAASLEEAHRAMANVVLVIPEAWEYVPQQRGSPVKWAAQHIIRQGRARGVFLWLDSQDVTGVEKSVLKSVDLWVNGRQREINEVRRILAQLPATQKPRPSDVMTLAVGQFFVAAEDWCKKVYVQPAWLDEETARRVALGEIAAVGPPSPAELVPVLASSSQPPVGDSPATGPADSTGQFSETTTYPVEEDPMVIADLRVRLAEAEQQRDSFKQRLVFAEQERDRLQEQNAQRDRAHKTELAELSRELQRIKGRVSLLEPIASKWSAFEQALAEIVRGIGGSGDGGINEAALEERIVARVGARGTAAQLAPLEALKHRFQEETVVRLVAQVHALEERPRQAILWLLSVGKPAHHRQICQALGFPLAGGSFVAFGKGIRDAVAAGLLDDGQSGLHVTIREKVVVALASYDPSPEDIEDTYQHLVAALATEADANT
jgi:hypothetical protein